MSRLEKQLALDALVPILKNQLQSCSILALGGTTIHMNPLGLVKTLIQASFQDDRAESRPMISGLDVVAGPLAGLAVDLLCGAGMVSRVRAAYVAAEYLGLCPNFMRAVKTGATSVWECGETIFLQGLQAAADGRPFGCTLEGLGTDILELNRYLVTFEEPLGGKKAVAVPPIVPDVCFIHVPQADQYGNCAHMGPVYSDFLMAAATKRHNGIVIVSTESVVSPADQGHLDNGSHPVTLPGSLVDHVVKLPRGAYPTACHSVYTADENEIRVYLSGGKTEASFQTWMQQNIFDGSNEESTPVQIQDRTEAHPPATDARQAANPGTIGSDSTEYSGAELLAVRLSECIGDFEFGSAGANSPIPQTAMRLAQLTHAPNLNFICSYSGYLCRFDQNREGSSQPGSGNGKSGVREKLFWSSFDVRNRKAAECALPSPDIFLLKRDFFFVGGMQFDRCGNVNLIGLGKPDDLKIRGPGSAGIGLVSATASGLFLHSATHEKRTIVDQVDFVSGIGHPDSRQKREQLGLPGAGPVLLMTPLCTFDFNEKGFIRLKSLNPGVSVETVLDRTGTEVDVPPGEIPVAPAPSSEQLKLIREQIDPDGILGRIKTS